MSQGKKQSHQSFCMKDIELAPDDTQADERNPAPAQAPRGQLPCRLLLDVLSKIAKLANALMW
jgi:hypothetical protein